LRSTALAHISSVFIIGLSIFTLNVPFVFAQPDSQKIEALPLEDLRIFTQVFSTVRANYIEDVDDATLLEYAVKGILSELDPHSAYLNDDKFDDLQRRTTGEFGGLGVEIGVEGNFIKVISPIDDTPAQKAGIEAGDFIIKIDGKSSADWGITKAIEHMRGEPGTSITLTIAREGLQPFDVEIIRDIIKVRSVRSELKSDHFAYIRIAMFQLNTGNDVKKAFLDLHKETPDLRGIILDLRGMIVYTEGRVAGANSQFFATAGDISNGLPIVVLINDGSASASEIVAGALQDHDRAVILGTQSFGKGSVQTVVPVSDDRAVKLTTALYYTPNGRSIQAQGITPDIHVERVLVTSVRARSEHTEQNLSGHLKNTTKDNTASTKANNNEKEMENKSTSLQNEDSQLFEALNLLKGIVIFNKSYTRDAR